MKTFEWCGYNWKSCMEGERLINPNEPWYWYSRKAIHKSGLNSLELYVRHNPNEITYWDGRTFYPEYEAGLMRTVEKFGFGTFSAEIKCPQGCSLWPSFWLSGDGNWPPEIDIMEAWSNNDRYLRFTKRQFPWVGMFWDTTTNVHYRNEQMQHENIGSEMMSVIKQCKNPTENFIRYECKWLPDKITFKANGKIVREVTGHVCEKLIKNIEHPENGYEMNVIFNVLCENPDNHKIIQKTPMTIRNFKYEKYEQQ